MGAFFIGLYLGYLCEMEQTIVNKVAQSQLITLNLEDFFPNDLVIFDLKDFLYMELVLKEKEFREALKQYDWNQFENKTVGITCTVDAIIPLWAYMLVASYLQPYTEKVFSGSEEDITQQALLKKISETDFQSYENKRIVLKGCGDRSIAAYAYVEVTKKLLPFVKSIMYGEPCSTVPVFKRK